MSLGTCRLIFGPMFSGKSTALRQEITTLADIGLRTLYINHCKDIRDKEISTHHSGFKGLSDKVKFIKTDRLDKIDSSLYDAIAIDEGQFFEDLDIIVRKWVLENNKTVIVASLDGNYLMQPFGKAHHLLCICASPNIIKLSAFCMKCKDQRTPAPYTAKISIDKKILSGDAPIKDEIGGQDKYIPVCLKCYQEHMATIT